MENSNNTPISKEKQRLTSIGFTVGEHLFTRISKILNLVRCFDQWNKITRQKWLEQAFAEKLTIEESQNIEDIPKERNLTFFVDEVMMARIEKRVDVISKFRRTYSKKKWFLEAIFEKLDRDEENVREHLNKLTRF